MVNIKNMAMNATVRMKAGENDLAVFYIGYFVMADSIDFWTSKNPNLPKPCIMLGILGVYSIFYYGSNFNYETFWIECAKLNIQLMRCKG